MKGLELSRQFYETYGKEMLEGSFSDYLPFISVGLVGAGSEVLGFDDEVSTDHDFEPGFCIFLPGEDVIDRKIAFQLERAYAKLPDEFMGYKRQKLSPVGGARHGVIRLEDFLLQKTGKKDGSLNMYEWLKIPTQYLLEVTKGELFFDGSGEFTKIREQLSVMPRDVRLKRLAGHLLLMSQAGQYNFPRMVKRKDMPSAGICAYEYIKNAAQGNTVRPIKTYYKWKLRGLKELDILSHLALPIEFLLTAPNDDSYVNEKYDRIELIATEIIGELISQGITSAVCGDLEKHAYSVNDYVNDGDLRSLNILSGT